MVIRPVALTPGGSPVARPACLRPEPLKQVLEDGVAKTSMSLTHRLPPHFSTSCSGKAHI